MQTTRADTSDQPASRAPALLSQPWYWNYVLGALTLRYVFNVIDRSQVLAASRQSTQRLAQA